MPELTRIAKGDITATIDSMGAQLMSLTCAGGEYLWQGDPSFWPRRAPVLFPIVGCLKNDEAMSAQGPVRLKRHGIARTREHSIVERSESSVTFQLDSDEATRELYPFDFRLNMVTDTADSMLAAAAGLIAPIFSPNGFGDWRISTALISGILAKESVVSTLSVLFGSTAALHSLLTPLSAFSLLVFCLLYTPCLAAIAAVRRELGGRWAIGMVVFQCTVAWLVSLLIFHAGRWLGFS